MPVNLIKKPTDVYGIYLNEINKLSEDKSEKENIGYEGLNAMTDIK